MVEPPKSAKSARLEIHGVKVSQGEMIVLISRDLDKVEAAIRAAKLTPPTDEFLTGIVTDASTVDLGTTVDTLTVPAEGEKWAQVIPVDMAKPAFTRAAVYLNLTQPQFLLHGTLTFGKASGVNALLYCAQRTSTSATQEQQNLPASPGASTTWSYAAALRAAADFRFGDLTPALADLDKILAVIDARLVVCNLTQTTLKDLANTTTTLLTAVDPHATPPLKDLPPEALTLKTGVYLAATINVGSSELLRHLVEIGKDGKAPTVTLYALIDRQQPKKTQFTANLPDITILDTITLTHIESYAGIHLTYQPAKLRAFTLEGRITLALFDKNLVFDLVLASDDKGLTASAQPTTQSLDQPFGLSGISLSKLYLEVTYIWATTNPPAPKRSQFTLLAAAAIGPAPGNNTPDNRLKATAALALLDGVPVLLFAKLDADVAIGAFLAQCLTGNAANWPSEFIELTIKQGSRLYYYDQAKKDPGKKLANFGDFSFEDGFHLAADITLTLLGSLTVQALVTITRGPQGRATGITTAITLTNPLDLSVVQLAGTTHAAGVFTGGPRLTITRTDTTKQFGISTGINFFGAAFTKIEVTVSPQPDGGRRFTGKLKAAEELKPFGLLECGFVYTTHPGKNTLEIKDWPEFDWVGKVLDLMQRIKEIADKVGGSICGTLVDTIENDYKEKLSLTPSVSAEGTNLVFQLTGTFSMTLVGAKDGKPFFSRDVGTLPITVPASTKWADLPEVLAKGIAAGTAKFAEDVLKEPETITLITTMVLGEKAVKYLATLACNGLVDSAVTAAAEAAADALAGLAGGARAVGAVATALAATRTSLQDSEEKKKQQNNKNDGSEGGPNPKPGRPTLLSLRYVDRTVTATWDAARYASSYTYEVLDPDGQRLGNEVNTTVHTGSVPVNPAKLRSGQYTGRVRSTRGTNVSQWSSVHIDKPASPSATLGYADDMLTAIWTPNKNTDAHQVRFTNPNGTLLEPQQTIPAGATTASHPLPKPMAGSYSVEVCTVRTDAIPADWAKTTLNILSLSAPVIQEVWYEDGKAHLTWQAGTGGGAVSRYQVRVTSGQTLVADSTGTDTNIVLAPLPGQQFAAGTAYQIQVRAHGTNALSPWAVKDFSYPDIPSPSGVTLTMDGQRFLASWQKVDPPPRTTATITYDARLFLAATPDTTLGSATGVTALSTSITRTDGQSPTDRDRYGVQVRARSGRNAGPWSKTAELVVRTLTVFAGGGTNTAENVPATEAKLNPVQGIATADGALYLAELGRRVSKVKPDGHIVTAVEDPNTLWLAACGSDTFYLSSGEELRKYTNGEFVTELGRGNAGYLRAVAVDPNGRIYVADSERNTIWRHDNESTEWAEWATVAKPFALCVDNNGTLYSTSNDGKVVVKLTDTGSPQRIAGGGTSTEEAGHALDVILDQACALCADTKGNVYIAEDGSQYQRVRKVTPQGQITTLVGSSFGRPTGLAMDAQGHLYISKIDGDSSVVYRLKD